MRADQLSTVLSTYDHSYKPLKPVIRFQHDPNFRPVRKWDNSTVTVTKCDTLDAAGRLHNPLILILADDEVPGGNFRALAGMQEESLFLRSALHRHLTPDMYPIGIEEALYAANVPLLAGGCVAFLACPGVKMPPVISNRLLPVDVAVLRKKAELIVQVAAKMGHIDLVLGALGAGVWGCPARHVAEVFREVLHEYHGTYRSATFAILGGNYQFFSDVLRV